MSWRRIYKIVILLLLASMVVKAQYSGMLKSFNEYSNRLEGKLLGEVYYMTSLANSNFFLQKDWVEGTITLKDDNFFSGIKLRYLANGDEIVAFNENIRALYIVDKNTVKQFTFRSTLPGGLGEERKFINLDSLNLTGGKSYFEELYAGSAQLLAFHDIEIIKVSPYTDNMGILRDSEYRLNATYYILSKQKGFTRIARKKSSMYNLYPDNKKEIRKLFRTNKISFREESSLIQAFRLLDEAGILN